MALQDKGEKAPLKEPVLTTVLEQSNQGHTTRTDLYRLIENILGDNRRWWLFFTSFNFPAGIADEDGVMLEDFLKATLHSNDKLVLMIDFARR